MFKSGARPVLPSVRSARPGELYKALPDSGAPLPRRPRAANHIGTAHRPGMRGQVEILKMRRKFAGLIAAAGVAILFSAQPGLAQPTLTPQGGGSYEMDHSRMGGVPAPEQHPGRPAPTLTPQGGSGNAEMDHGRMGGANLGSPSGGTITGNSGDSGGPEVRHGHESGMAPRG